MCRYLQMDKACKAILVEKTDRLYRNLKDWVLLDELGVEIHLVKEGVVISENSVSSEKFIHGIKIRCGVCADEGKRFLLVGAQEGPVCLLPLRGVQAASPGRLRARRANPAILRRAAHERVPESPGSDHSQSSAARRGCRGGKGKGG